MKSPLKLLKKYSYVIVFIILETIALLLLGNYNAYHKSKLSSVSRELSGGIYERVSGIRGYLHLKKTNEVLSRENTILRNKLDKYLLLPDSIKQDLPNTQYFYTPAKVVHLTRQKQYNYITINKGSKQGITSDMAVLGDAGIVGIVLESSANYATVIPIINRNFRASVLIENGNYAGILKWNGNSVEKAQLTEIPYHARFTIGDSVLTSGFSSIFPEGLYVGKIAGFELKEGNFFNIDVDLGTNFSNLFHVNVINNFNQTEQLKLESKLEDD